MTHEEFIDKAAKLWEKFDAFSKDPNNSQAAVVAAEKQYDSDYNALWQAISRPGGTPDRRR